MTSAPVRPPDRMTAWICGPSAAAQSLGEHLLLLCARARVPGAVLPVSAGPGIEARHALWLGRPPAEFPGKACDVLVALDAGALAQASSATRAVVYDAGCAAEPPGLRPGAVGVGVPGTDISTLCGVLSWFAGLGRDLLQAGAPRRLRGADPAAEARHLQAARAALAELTGGLGQPPCAVLRADARLALLGGGEALGWGALAGGCTVFAAPEAGAGRGPAQWLASRAQWDGLASQPAADEAAALGLAAGAAAAGARALADITSGSLAAAEEMLRFCCATGLPVVILAPDDGWECPEALPVLELAPRNAREAWLMTAEAFNLAEQYRTPAVVRCTQALLGLWEAAPRVASDIRIARGCWARGADAPPEARFAPGQDGPPRIFQPLPAEALSRKRKDLRGAIGVTAAPGPGETPLFAVPEPAPLDERRSRPDADFLRDPGAQPRDPAAAAVRFLAGAWSRQGWQPREIVVVAGAGGCPDEGSLPKTYGLRVPAGCALAVAGGLKLANPALRVTALDSWSAVRGSGQLRQAARCNPDLVLGLFMDADSAPEVGAGFQARVGLTRPEAGDMFQRAAAHIGFSLLELHAGAEPACEVLKDDSSRPSFEDSDPVLARHGAPVKRAIDLRAQRCAALQEEFL